MTPQVTVVIPTKDRWPVLRTTLASVLAQRHVSFRVVVVDDGGGDGTSDRLAALGDPRVDVVRHERSLGVSRARNAGLAEVASPWVAFLDDDDLWSPDKLARQLAALARSPQCRWACSTAVNFYSDGAIYGIHRPPPSHDVSDLILLTNSIPGGGSGVLADTAAARDIGGFEPGLANLADWDCWIRLAQVSPLAAVGTTDVGYRRHPTSIGHDVARSEAELEVILARHAELYRHSSVSFDRLPWLWYLETLTYSSGDWFGGLRRSASIVRRHHHPGAVAEPFRQLLPDAVRRRRRERWVAKANPLDHAHARAWLDAQLGADPDRRSRRAAPAILAR